MDTMTSLPKLNSLGYCVCCVLALFCGIVWGLYFAGLASLAGASCSIIVTAYNVAMVGTSAGYYWILSQSNIPNWIDGKTEWS